MTFSYLVPQPPHAPENAGSVIRAGATVEGNCKIEGSIQIDGTLEGSVQSTASIAIGRGSTVVGEIISQDAAIAGRIRGRLIVASKLELQASCHVEGEIETSRLLIEEGATVNAAIKMSDRRNQPSQSRS